MENIIPKRIHYCWFGNSEKPKFICDCINTWKTVLNDYEIIEWNENNFNININKYVKEAYEQKKYAFVSDYVRVYALYNYGGIYFDTDVTVFKKFDDLLENDSFWGFEEKNYIATSTIGAKKGNKLIKKFLDSYENKSFLKEDGAIDTLTNVAIVSKIISNLGVKLDGTFQKVENIAAVYPQEYFSPYDYINCYSKKTDKSYAMHHFYKSWLPFSARLKAFIKKSVAKIFGGENIAKLRNKFQA